jgi:hypothetical protein
MSFPIPTGSYAIMNATTHTYLNVLPFNPALGAIVRSVRNHLGSDIVHLPRARRGGGQWEQLSRSPLGLVRSPPTRRPQALTPVIRFIRDL